MNMQCLRCYSRSLVLFFLEVAGKGTVIWTLWIKCVECKNLDLCTSVVQIKASIDLWFYGLPLLGLPVDGLWCRPRQNSTQPLGYGFSKHKMEKIGQRYDRIRVGKGILGMPYIFLRFKVFN